MTPLEQPVLPRASRRMRVTAFVVAVVGLVMSLAAWSWRRDVEQREFGQALATETENLRAMLARDVGAFFD